MMIKVALHLVIVARLMGYEIALLVGPADAPAPLFDTTSLHARRAAEWALGDELERPLPAGCSATGTLGR